MEKTTITLRGSLSHTVKLKGKPELKLIKGKGEPTTDRELIAYARAKPGLFVVTGTPPSSKTAAKASAAKRKTKKKPVKKTAKRPVPKRKGVEVVEENDES